MIRICASRAAVVLQRLACKAMQRPWPWELAAAAAAAAVRWKTSRQMPLPIVRLSGLCAPSLHIVVLTFFGFDSLSFVRLCL